jgi:hypothetical protein
LNEIYDNGFARHMADTVRTQAADRQKISDPVISSYKALVSYIDDFQRELDSDHEVGARLVNFGSEIRFHIQDVGYTAPTLITFTGVLENGDRVQLVQHVSQLSVLLIAVAKREEKPFRVGFQAV